MYIEAYISCRGTLTNAVHKAFKETRTPFTRFKKTFETRHRSAGLLMKRYTSFTQLEQVYFYYGVSLSIQVRKRSQIKSKFSKNCYMQVGRCTFKLPYSFQSQSRYFKLILYKKNRIHGVVDHQVPIVGSVPLTTRYINCETHPRDRSIRAMFSTVLLLFSVVDTLGTDVALL